MRIPSSHLRRLLIFSFAFTTYIKAGAQLHADFTSNIKQGCSPLIVQFTDVSTGNPTGWFWDLGNGATSTDSAASAFYFNPGSYTVKLHIKNTTGEDSVIKSNYITVYDKPSIAFTASPSEGCAPLDVQFTDLSKAGSGDILSWIWDFGDGLISTAQNPLHTYNVLDSFNVLLTVTNSFGCKNTFTEPSLIKIKGVVIAGFSYKYDNACKAPVTVKFTNASQSTQILTYQWSFGDGTPVSTYKNPEHIYATTGNFTVKLTVTNASGCSSTYSEPISIGSTITDFTFTNPCLNQPAIFTDSSAPTPISEIWNFGDGTTDTGYQVSHIYTTGSSYNVTLTADFGGCMNTKTKTIQINKKPVVDFKATNNRNTCMVPDTVQFLASLQNATAFKWLFGDGSTSTSINPTHIYKVPGKFIVSLIAYNANGCSDTVVKENFVQIGPPQIVGVENLPFGGCAPQTLTFNPIIDFNSTIISYNWDFGDSSTSTNAVPVHQYKNTGIYNVTLMVSSAEGCKDTLLMLGGVALGKAPTALFDAWPVDICGKKPVKFKDTSSGLPTSWLWFFGQGSSTEQNPSHTYSDTGYFNVTLIASQYGCSDTLVKIGYIHVNPPVAKFGYTSYCKNLYTYYFSDSSISPKTWHWDFGDGSTSTSQNPIHTYGSKGSFVVSLTVTNSGCSYTRSDTLNIIRESPSIQYEFLSTNSCKYDSIRFSAVNYDTANVKSIKWDFGDSVTTYQKWNEDFIYHFYNDAGTYFPLLIIRDINGCLDTIDTHTQVQVFGPKAAFSNVGGDCLLSTINFNDETSSDGMHAVTTWIWDFGDGTPPETFTAPPFEHSYTSTGTFNVSLKVIDNNNCYDTITNSQNLSISRPVADFIATDTISCSHSPVQFIDSSKGGDSITYKWNFGDGMYSFKSNPMHSFIHEGLYDVKLIIKDQFNCTDSIIKPKYIRVADPMASFILTDSLFLCPPAKISPVNTSVNFSSLLWDFGDGNTSSDTMPDHYYNTAGLYTLRLIATGYGQCSDTFTKPFVLRGPLAKLNYSPLTGCAPLHVSFTAKAVNTLKYLWDFGNGVLQTTSLPATNYTYTVPGDFLPQLVIVDSSGCQVAVTIPDTIVVGGARANYLVSAKEGICDSSLYNFADSSVVSFDKILSYNWQFGDGDSSSGINSYHYYTRAGLYKTSLNITTENGCVATYQVPVNVLIDSTPQVFATFPDTACINAPVSLNAGVTNSSPGKFSWLWSLGNGDSRYTNNALYSYSTPGTYKVYVVGTSAAGCSDTVFHTTRVAPLPFTDAGSDIVICRGESAHLTATGADAYTWSRVASLSCTTCPDPVATPLRNTTYFLTGVNSFGCKAIDSVDIQVKQPIHVSISAPDTICIGSSIQLKAAGAELYNWQPASQVTNSTDSITLSTPSSTTKYSVIGTDNAGCFSDTASLTVNVFPLPTVQLPDSIVTVNSGSGYQAEAKGSPDIISWNWSPLKGLSCSACANPLITPPENETYTLEVKNITGCKAESHISFIVTCKGQNLFIPNTFSPNADGMNDYFYPRGKGIMNVQLFRVFSRWGTVVYERANFPPNQQSYGWDGTYNGKALQSDVYVFIAEVACENGEIISLKGNVTLLR